MAKDTFKRTAPTIEFFKDGETIRAKKLGKIVQDIQDGMASLEAAVGDIHNRAIAFEGNPLFQNSIGRAIGPMDKLTVLPYRQFAMIQKTKDSLHKGLIRWPHAGEAASAAGNLSSNLLPMYEQVDKTGIGCTHDDGNRCTAGFQSIYDQEKNIVPNGGFTLPALSGLEVSDATIRYAGGVQLDVVYHYNYLDYSENFENWTMVGPTTLVQRDPLPDPNGQNAAYKITPQFDENIFTAIQHFGSSSIGSSDWCFAVWLATSGHREVYLQISGLVFPASSVSGSLEGGPIEILRQADDNNYDRFIGLDISGLEWRRYWIHAGFDTPVTADTLLCRVVLGISGRVDTTPLFMFGGQLEPTNYPTEYRRTQGSATSGLGTEASVGYSLSVVPGHTYQVTLAGSGTIHARVNGETLFSLPADQTGIFVATDDTAVVDAYVSGTSISEAYLTLLRVDPGTPCHAMNCPGFSAYEKIRSYRAVLPAITVSGHQYFAQRLGLPDEFQEALSNELPGNILGVFDHELNHAVPDRIVDWRLANWPIGGLDLGGILDDPEFFDLWTTVGNDTYPTELLPTTGSGIVTRDIVITTVSSGITSGYVMSLAPYAWWSSQDIDGSGTQNSGHANLESMAGWGDKTGNGHYLPRVTPIFPVTFHISGGPNNKPYVDTGIGGFDPWLGTAFGNPAGWTVFFVIRGAVTLGSGGLHLLRGNATTKDTVLAIPYVDEVTNPLNAVFLNNSTGAGTAHGVYKDPNRPLIPVGWSGSTGNNWHSLAWEYSGTHRGFHQDGEMQTSVAPQYLGDFPNGTRSLAVSDWQWLFRTNPGLSNQAMAVSEIILFNRGLSDEERNNVRLWLSDEYDATFTSGAFVSGYYADRVIVTTSGNSEKGLVHTFPLAVGTVYTFEYRVKADIDYSGVFESFVVPSGAAEVDLLIDDTGYQTINPSGLKNYYKVDEDEPGTTVWSEEAPGQFWYIHRRLRATEPGTLINITVGISGNGSVQSATFDSFDVSAQSSNSTIFKYSADPVLGLNWEGSAVHVTEENLWPWSENLGFTQLDDGNIEFEFKTPDPSGNLTATVVRGSGIVMSIPADYILDSTMTVQFWARSNDPDNTNASASVYFSSNVDSGLQEYVVTEDWQQFSFMFSGIQLVNMTSFGLEISSPDPGMEQEIAWLVVHHGSGIVPYEKTDGRPIRRYRRSVRVDDSNLFAAFDKAYGLTNTMPILNTMVAPTISGLVLFLDPDATDFVNLPDSGVVRVQGQEFAYRGKLDNGALVACVPKWRGTNFDESYLVSGKTVTYVPLPRAIDHIESGLVYFEDVLPAPDGDWANQMHLQIYNTQISNLGRFSLTASAVPLTRAAGTLMTAFMHHVADDDRHFRRDQLCAALIDPSVQAGFDDMEVRLEMAQSPVQEVNQEAILSIFAFGFMDSNDKEIRINWGDGTIESGIFVSGNHFDPFEHTYDLGAYNRALQHTISVEVTDLNLLVSRSNSVSIVVTPVTKGSQTVRTQIITQLTATQQARTAIFAHTSGLQQSRTYVL